MIINILGTDYTVTHASEADDPRLEGIDGFCDETIKELVYENYRRNIPYCKGRLDIQEKKVLRHEIVHAFLFESGLAENSEWAKNEEMVDWIAAQAPKLIKAWTEAEAL